VCSLTLTRFQNDSVVHLVEEEDGVRIVGRDTVEFFRKVPCKLVIITCKTNSTYTLL